MIFVEFSLDIVWPEATKKGDRETVCSCSFICSVSVNILHEISLGKTIFLSRLILLLVTHKSDLVSKQFTHKIPLDQSSE